MTQQGEFFVNKLAFITVCALLFAGCGPSNKGTHAEPADVWGHPDPTSNTSNNTPSLNSTPSSNNSSPTNNMPSPNNSPLPTASVHVINGTLPGTNQTLVLEVVIQNPTVMTMLVDAVDVNIVTNRESTAQRMYGAYSSPLLGTNSQLMTDSRGVYRGPLQLEFQSRLTIAPGSSGTVYLTIGLVDYDQASDYFELDFNDVRWKDTQNYNYFTSTQSTVASVYRRK